MAADATPRPAGKAKYDPKQQEVAEQEFRIGVEMLVEAMKVIRL